MAIRRHGRGYEVVIYTGIDPITKRQLQDTERASSYDEAKDTQREMRQELAEGGRRPEGRKKTMNNLLDRWLRVGSQHWSPSTYYGYRNIVEREIRPELGPVLVRKVTAEHLDMLYTGMRERGLKGRSVRNVHAVLKAVFRQAIAWKWTNSNPALFATPGYLGGAAGVKATEAEIDRLLDACSDELYLAIRLASSLGLRRSELCGLRWEDVDFDNGKIRIHRARVHAKDSADKWLHDKDTKTHNTRELHLLPGLLLELKEFRGLPLARIVPLEPWELSRELRALLDQTGLYRPRLGWHSMRHFVGDRLVKRKDPRTAADFMGHSRPSTTMNMYSSSDEDDMKAAAQEFATLDRPRNRKKKAS